MRRRTFIATLGATGVVGLAGCLVSEVDGDVVVDETVYGDTSTYTFDVEAGQTVNTYVENAEGHQVHILIQDPDGDEELDEMIETEDTFSFTADSTGAYRAHITPIGNTPRANVEIGVED